MCSSSGDTYMRTRVICGDFSYEGEDSLIKVVLAACSLGVAASPARSVWTTPQRTTYWPGWARTKKTYDSSVLIIIPDRIPVE